MGYNPDPTIKPPVGSYIDWGNPLTHALQACYIFNEFGSNLINDLTCYQNNSLFNGNNIGLGTASWVAREKDYGIYFDNTQATVGNTIPTPLILNTPANGFWFNAQTEFSLFFRFSLEPPAAGGPLILCEVGGSYYGFSVQYRTTPQQMTFAVTNSGTAGTYSEIYCTDIIVPSLTEVHDLLAVFKNGQITLWLDGKYQTTAASGYSEIGYHSSLPGLGGTGAGETTSGYWTLYSSADEWSGCLFAFYFFNTALDSSECLHCEPYNIISWPVNRKYFSLGTVVTNLITSSLEQSQQIQSLTLTQDQNISLKNILGNQELDKILVNQIQNILTSNILETQSLSSISITTAVILSLSAIAQSQNISLVKLLQIQNIVTNLLEQDQELDLITITQIQNILEQAISQNQDVSSVALNTAVVLAVSALLQNEQLKDINVTQNQNILTDALNQQQRLIELALTQLQNIKISNIDETQSISSVALNLAVVLVLSAIKQNQDLYDFLVNQIQNILPDTLDQTQNLENLTVSQLLDIVLQNLLQSSKLSDVFLKQYEAIPEPIKTLVAEFFEFIISFKP